MALRRADLVVCGEVIHSRKHSTHGWLGLRGFERPLIFQLTGDPNPDLAGRHIRFEVRQKPGASGESEQPPAPEADSADEKELLKRLNLTGLAWMQVGPTGTMTATRRVRVADCPPVELYLRCKLDEPPPMEWKNCLYLEWYSQNGRVVVELVDPIIEYVDCEPPAKEDRGDEGSADGTPADEAPRTGLGITSIQIHDDGEVEIRDESPQVDDDGECHDEDDPYGLMPRDLQRQLTRRRGRRTARSAIQRTCRRPSGISR